MKRPAVAPLALWVLIAAAPVDAQRSGTRGNEAPRSPAISPSEARSLAIRAELAEVLLQSARYTEAAREYRRLVDADSTNTRYRLGLAQALAWGERYREAERELRILAVARPRDAAVDTLLRSVRQSMQPRAREAAEWVHEQPRYLPYRFALARALVREGRPRDALAHYDSLIAVETTPALLRETASTYRAANDLPGGLALLRTAVTRAPSDTAIRRAYSALLVEGRQLDAALAQLDTVLLLGSSPAVLIERARINIARQDLDAAAVDLNASIAAGPTVDAHLVLGDIHRWRGDYSSARASYDRAGALSPASREVTARFAQLARDERPAVVFGTPIDVQQGWRTYAAHASDKVGTRYSTLSAHRGFSAPFAVLGSVGAEVRHLRERLPSEEAQTTGYVAELALSRGASYGAMYGELRAKGGIAHHPGAGSSTFGTVGVNAQYFAWSASAELSEGPAYPSLLTTAFLTASDRGGPWLSERTLTGSLAGPISVIDAGVSVRRSEFSDDNRRTAVQAYGRYPLSPRLSAVYSGSAISFANRSTLYWDPSSHITNAIGIQVAERRPRGFSYSASVLPGVAWAEDSPYLRAPISGVNETRMRPQIAAAGELLYRGDGWEASAAYGWGRLGGYERNDARIGLRFAP